MYGLAVLIFIVCANNFQNFYIVLKAKFYTDETTVFSHVWSPISTILLSAPLSLSTIDMYVESLNICLLLTNLVRKMFSKFIYIVTNVRISFFCENPLYAYTTFCFSIHQRMSQGYFFLAVVNNAALNIDKYFFKSRLWNCWIIL